MFYPNMYLQTDRRHLSRQGSLNGSEGLQNSEKNKISVHWSKHSHQNSTPRGNLKSEVARSTFRNIKILHQQKEGHATLGKVGSNLAAQ